RPAEQTGSLSEEETTDEQHDDDDPDVFCGGPHCLQQGHFSLHELGRPRFGGEMAYSLVNYEFGGPRCKSRESGVCCIFHLVLERETGVPGSCEISSCRFAAIFGLKW